MSIKGQAAKGVMWNAIERFSTQGIQFVLTILIARVLSPQDYGLIAMLMVFMAIAQAFIDGGFSNVLIQKQDRTETDYCTIFYFNVTIALFFYLLLFVFAPCIADFYRQPELVKIIRIYCTLLIINSFTVIQIARLTIALDFKKMAYASFFSVLTGGGVGVWMAYSAYGVWALVCQSIVGSLVWVCSLWILARWYPIKSFSIDSFRKLWKSSVNLLCSTLINTIYTNMYSLVIGRFFQVSALGYFNRAYTLSQFPVQNFGSIVLKVLYPILCRYQDDEKAFNRMFSYYLKISAFILFPLMIGFIALSDSVITLLLTEKWLPAASLLRYLAFAFMWLPIMQANVAAVDAKGRMDYHLQSELIKKAFAVIILFCTLFFGLEVVCCGMILYSFVDLIIIIAYSRRLTSIGYKSQLVLIFPKLILSVAMGGLVWMVSLFFEEHICKLISGIVCGAGFYMLFAGLFKWEEWTMIKRLFIKRDFFNS